MDFPPMQKKSLPTKKTEKKKENLQYFQGKDTVMTSDA